MEGASPARTYCTVVGGVLVVAGIVGFFYSSSFGSPGDVDNVFGILAINGWHNLVHIALGAVGLAAAASAAREYALYVGILYLVLAVWGFVIGSGESILGFVPVNTEDNFLHLILGVLGVGAAIATPQRSAPTAPPPAAAA